QGLNLEDGTRVSARMVEAVRQTRPDLKLTWVERNRDAAEAILALGAPVHVRVGEDERVIKTPAELPCEYFRLTQVHLADVKNPLGEVLPRLSRLTDRKFDGLESIDLSGTDVRDNDLATLASLPSLKSLSFARTKITDSGMVHLRNLKSLYTLDVSDCDFKGAGLAHLKELKLEKLSLASSRLNTVGLGYLRPLVTLRALDLTGVKADPSDLEALRKALPNCRVKN